MAYDSEGRPEIDLLLVQAERCERLASIIDRNEPHMYDQDSFGLKEDSHSYGFTMEPACGTPACMAGWMVRDMKAELAATGHDLTVNSLELPDAASEVLGVDADVFARGYRAAPTWQKLLGDEAKVSETLFFNSFFPVVKRDDVIHNLRALATKKRAEATQLVDIPAAA